MDEVELKDIIKWFWKKKIQIVIIVALFIVIGCIYTFKFASVTYKSTAKILITPVEVESIGADNQVVSTTLNVSINNQLIPTYIELIKSQAIAKKVKSNLNLNLSETEIAKNIDIVNVKNTTILQITATNKNGEIANKIANEAAKVFIEYVNENYNLDNVLLVDEATKATKQSEANHTKHLIIFTAIGVILAAGYVILIAIFNRKITSVAEVEKIAKDIPVIGTIPDCTKIQNGGNN